MSWWLPLKASTFAGEIDGLFTAVLIITGIAFVVVEIGLVWFSLKYRNRPGRTAYYTHGNNTAEIIWTAIPAVTVEAVDPTAAGDAFLGALAVFLARGKAVEEAARAAGALAALTVTRAGAQASFPTRAEAAAWLAR